MARLTAGAALLGAVTLARAGLAQPALAPAAAVTPTADPRMDDGSAARPPRWQSTWPRGLAHLDAASKAAAEVWLRQLLRPPKPLPSAEGAPPLQDLLTPQALEARVRYVGALTVTNREWRAWWSQVREFAEAAATALPSSDPLHADARTWAGLAQDEIRALDAALETMDRERDGLDERLELNVDAADAKRPPPAEVTNPWEQRRRDIAALEGRLEGQRQRSGAARALSALIRRQQAALGRRIQLTGEELALVERAWAAAAVPAQRVGPLQPLWRHLEGLAQARREQVERVAETEALRLRAWGIELGLIDAQLHHRGRRIAELDAELSARRSLASWASAAIASLWAWAQHRAATALASLLALYGLTLLLQRAVRRGLNAAERRATGRPDDPHDDDTRALTLITVGRSVAAPALWLVAAWAGLELMGFNTAPLLGSVAILGLAVSFGAQNLVRDVVNGIFILVEHQYAVGEIIEVDGKIGKVERITIRSTWMRQFNGDLYIVPNGVLAAVGNKTRDWSRPLINVGVAYAADIEQTRAVLVGVAEELWSDPVWKDRLLEELQWEGVTSLADSAVVHRMAGKVRPGAQWEVEREFLRRAKLALDRAGIEIPFPQRTIWHRHVDAPPRA